MISNDISSVQNQIQNATQIHHGGGGHGKKINKMPFAVSEAERKAKIKPKDPLKSEQSTKIAVNPDADSKHQEQQQDRKSSQEQNSDEEAEAEGKSFGLDTLEQIGQSNMIMIYTLANIKKSDQI